MQDLSLHILDVTQNSISAMANMITITIDEDSLKDWLQIEIMDNGNGMDEDTILKITDPFYTTRTTRKVGLGLPLFKATAERCGGSLTVESALGKGTTIKVGFILGHIDRPPIGRMDETIASLILCNPQVNFIYNHKTTYGGFSLDTKEIQETLGDVPIEEPEVIMWIQSYIKEGLSKIDGGVQ
ncbi:MAG TPA: ATP-binding protein [Clostridia bacterium]|nr:ATP-binding protein [Clostridia bacterium]